MTLDRPVRFPLSPGDSALGVTLLLAAVSCALEARDVRDRAFTLLHDAYQSARRVVAFLRAREGDADTVTPTFYGGGRRSGTGATPPTQPATPGTTTALPHAASSSAGSDIAPAGNPAREGSPLADE